METFEPSQSENVMLLKIIHLRDRLGEIHAQSGPNSSKYIDLSIQLNLLEKEYIEKKIKTFKGVKTSFFITKIPRSFEK
ncbi:hypothetical protein R4Z10_18315 [Niallia sp. XMNu-256]|uniref:hypothetical protein n=1 Tax=Niallia sp. XMNu-256 TaxID=3082444 RepID=UPI0030CD782D